MNRARRSLAIALALAASLTPATLAGGADGERGGLTIEPAILAGTAVRGWNGALEVRNSARVPMRVAIAPRPWIQRRDGTVVPNPSRGFGRLRVGRPSFLLRAGQSRRVGLRLLARPAGGSLYGALEVVGNPVRSGAGLRLRYRLLGSLRLDPPPASRRLRLAVGKARAGKRGALVSVANRGNVLAALGGTVRMRGAGGTLRAQLPAVRILPGAEIDLRLHRGGLAPGRYVARIALRSGERPLNPATRRFTVR